MARMYEWRKRNHEKLREQRKRERVRRRLRDIGQFPPVGVEMTPEQKLIDIQISNNDFTYWDSIKTGGTTRKRNNWETQVRQPYVLKTKEELLLTRVKQSAKEKKLEFNLTLEDIIIPEYCPLLNIKLTFEFTLETKDSYYTLDRIDSSLGYIKGNVQVVSFKANTMKNNATEAELITFAKSILSQFS